MAQGIDDLLELLPTWAVEVEHLEYGLAFAEPGLYFALFEDGQLAAVGVVEKGVPPSWVTAKDELVFCRSLLSIAPGGTMASTRGRTWVNVYGGDGKLRLSNGYDEAEEVKDAELPLLSWLEQDIRAKVDEVRQRIRGEVEGDRP